MTIRNRGGRPKLNPSEKRDKIIKFSCTEAEYEFFKKHAKQAGYQQTARFLHDVTISIINEGRFEYREQKQINADLLGILTCLARNTHQAMHEVHEPGENNQPNFYTSLNESLDIIIEMAEITQLGVRKKCHIDNSEKVQHGNS